MIVAELQVCGSNLESSGRVGALVVIPQGGGDTDWSELFGKRPRDIKPGLARLQAALAHLDQAQLLATPTVLIAGTNGKGTTAAFLWRQLVGLGLRVGLFTSPHLCRFSERIVVGDCKNATTSATPPPVIDDGYLARELKALQAALPTTVYAALSFFEVSTLLAWRVFHQVGTDLNLLEVGMGGRWDATNAATPCLSLITSIGLDHTEFLGPTTAAIAAEKAGIMRPGVPVLWGGDTAGDAAAVAVLRRTAAGLGAPFWELGREVVPTSAGLTMTIPGLPPTQGQYPPGWAEWPGYLRQNFQLAAAALQVLAGTKELAPLWHRLDLRPGTELAARAVEAMTKVAPPPCASGRFERRTVSFAGKRRDVLLDVCHNVAGAQALVAGLRSAGLSADGPLPGMVSVLADKDCDGLLDVLRPVLNPLYLFAVHSERSWSEARLAPRHRGLPFFGDCVAAWQAADGERQPLVICGSVHAIGEVGASLQLSGYGAP